MEFGPVPIDQAEGAVLSHSLGIPGGRLRKGTVLTAEHLAALRKAGLNAVVVARLAPDDVPEDEAAARIGAALDVPDTLALTDAATGRVNVIARASGVLRIDRAAVDRLNAVDPAITLATLPDWARVADGQMVATIKIMPYAVPGSVLARAEAAVSPGSLRLHPFRLPDAAVILTRTPGFKDSLIEKGRALLAARLSGLGMAEGSVETVPHDSEAVAAAVRRARGAMILILGASATSDAADVCPAGMVAAGGRLIRFGMPVDPGNLLFLGDLDGRPVVGLPGCARSPALNGVDWVLERLAAGIAVSAADIAAMGVGGLLKEIPTRPQPRRARPASARATTPRVAAILLAAGQGRRMGGRDKLLEPVDGHPLLRVLAARLAASRADPVVVVVPPDAPARAAALEGLAVHIVVAGDAALGMSASLKAGLRALDPAVDAALVALADMPELETADFNRLIAAFDPAAEGGILRGASAAGRPGHPVLFARRHFEALAAVSGDQGAREVLAAAGAQVVTVTLPGDRAITDLDTPEAWASWRKRVGA